MLAANGPDRPSMAVYPPRAQMWLGAVYETLARQEAAEPRRHDDWSAAAEHYSLAQQEWQKLHGRADIVRFENEITDCAKKAAECNRRAASRV